MSNDGDQFWRGVCRDRRKGIRDVVVRGVYRNNYRWKEWEVARGAAW